MADRDLAVRGFDAAGRGRPVEEAALRSETDDELLDRFARGDDAAWRVLVDRHLRSVHGYAWYMLNDHAEAEDVAQETFVRLLGKAPDWQPGGARLRTWLYRVAINMCIDRRRAIRPEPLENAADGPDFATGDAHMDHRLDLARNVEAALQRLGERQRTAIVLVHYQGFTNAETAALLDCSVEAVESLLARARRALRQSLAPVADDLLGER